MTTEYRVTTTWLQAHADWLGMYHRKRKAQIRALGGGDPCDPKDEPPTTGTPEQWLIHCRVEYLEDLLDCLELPLEAQPECCNEAYVKYVYCCTHPPGGGGG